MTRTARRAILTEHAIDLFHRELILAYLNAPKGRRLKALARLQAYVNRDLGGGRNG